MNLSKKILILIAALICILVSVMMLFNYKDNNDIKIIVSDNEKAEKYAKKYSFELEKLSDSEKTTYKKNIEVFDYNILDNGIEITKYDGKSKTLVIPERINAFRVVSVKKEVLENIDTLIISEYMESLPVEDLKNIKIKCYENDFCNTLKNNNELNVEVLSDTDYVDFDNNTLHFEYNIDKTIEITDYISSDKNIIIPETINGYEVTKISLDSTKIDMNSIYIPSTVEELNIIIDNQNKTNLIWSIIINIITFAIFTIIVLVNSSKNKEESFLNTAVYIVSIIYLLIQYICMIGNTQPIESIVKSSGIRLIIYLIIVLPLIFVKKTIKTYDDKVKETGNFIRESLSMIDDIDTTEYNEEEKEILNKIKEDLRFSDPVSSETTETLEERIKKLLSADSKSHLDEIERLIKKRNKVCKETK